jgi:hypothetical protein
LMVGIVLPSWAKKVGRKAEPSVSPFERCKSLTMPRLPVKPYGYCDHWKSAAMAPFVA